MSNSKDLIRGAVDLLILKFLMAEDCYGYQLTKLISEKSNDLIKIPVGSLYPSLYRMLEKGYISEKQQVVGKRLRTYYHITESGEKYYASLLNEYIDITIGIQNIVGDVMHRKE
jgi:PadR family transcriptional regulator PadR